MLLMAFFYPVTCMNEDSARAEDSVGELSSSIF